MAHKEQFINSVLDVYNKKGNNSKLYTEEEYNKLMEKLKMLVYLGPSTKDKHDYYLIKQFELQRIDSSFLVLHKKSRKIVVYIEQVYEIIENAHVSTRHGGRQATLKILNEKYYNISQEIVTIFIDGCETCQLKRTNRKTGSTMKPSIFNHLNSRCQVDLIDFQARPDGDYKFILVYQDDVTKYVRLKALKTNTAKDVAYSLLDIFTDVGAPVVLQSDVGREFSNQVVEQILSFWPDCHIVHGSPRHSQSQGSIENVNQDIETELTIWLQDNNTTKWSEGLRYIQFYRNRSFHSLIGKSPYEALYGKIATDGLNSLPVPFEHIKSLRTEEDLARLLHEKYEASSEDVHSIVKIDEDTSLIQGNTSHDSLGNRNEEIENSNVNSTKQVDTSEREIFKKTVECKCCKDEDMCLHSQKKLSIYDTIGKYPSSLKRQAETMLDVSQKRFKPVEVDVIIKQEAL